MNKKSIFMRIFLILIALAMIVGIIVPLAISIN